MYSQIITYDRQTAFDIALEKWGSVEGVFELLAANPGLRLDSGIATGTVLKIDGVVVNKGVAEYYAQKGIHPATGGVSGQVAYEKETNKKVVM